MFTWMKNVGKVSAAQRQQAAEVDELLAQIAVYETRLASLEDAQKRCLEVAQKANALIASLEQMWPHLEAVVDMGRVAQGSLVQLTEAMRTVTSAAEDCTKATRV